MLKSRRDKEVNPKHWYIVVLKKGKPKVGRRFFKTEKEAYNFLKVNKINKLGVLLLRGDKVLDYELKIYNRKAISFLMHKKLLNYTYPVDRITIQDRKSFRTKSRRWMRDYGKLPNNYTDFKASS